MLLGLLNLTTVELVIVVCLGVVILVVPVIDPGMAPLFGMAAGLIAEMGGTLSHGAIIAREYGLPVLVNVPYVTSLLRENEQVEIASSTGRISRLVS